MCQPSRGPAGTGILVRRRGCRWAPRSVSCRGFHVQGSDFAGVFCRPHGMSFFPQMWEAAIVATEWDCSTRLEFSLSARDWGLEPATSLFCLSTLTALVFEEHRFLGSIGVEINGVTVCLPSPPPPSPAEWKCGFHSLVFSPRPLSSTPLSVCTVSRWLMDLHRFQDDFKLTPILSNTSPTLCSSFKCLKWSSDPVFLRCWLGRSDAPRKNQEPRRHRSGTAPGGIHGTTCLDGDHRGGSG